MNRKVFFLSLCLISACGGDAPFQNLGDIELTSEGKADKAVQVRLSSGKQVTFNVTSKTSPIALTIDCSPPSNPDELGLVFSMIAPDFGIEEEDAVPPRAGYFRAARKLNPGKHGVTLIGMAGAGSCSIGTKTLRSTAVDSTIFRSANTNHTHFRVGSDASSDWEEFPVSGNHWGAWAAWGQDYPEAIKRGFLLHNLEHGGLVYSYNCDGCEQVHDDLLSVANDVGAQRQILTPDPTQPTRYAVRAWRWGYLSNSFDKATMLSFAKARIRHGREDIDADPPIPFDPSTTNVPCEDIMAAPDSCR